MAKVKRTTNLMGITSGLVDFCLLNWEVEVVGVCLFGTSNRGRFDEVEQIKAMLRLGTS